MPLFSAAVAGFLLSALCEAGLVVGTACASFIILYAKISDAAMIVFRYWLLSIEYRDVSPFSRLPYFDWSLFFSRRNAIHLPNALALSSVARGRSMSSMAAWCSGVFSVN